MEQSIFGPTVEQIEAARRAKQQAEMLQIASLSPQQQRVFFGGMGGGMLGNGLADLGQAAGVPFIKDRPEIEDAKVMKGVVEDVRKSGADVTDTVSFYRKVADKLASAGKTEAAMGLSLKATMTEFELNKKAAEARKLDAEALSKLREKESKVAGLQREFATAMREKRTADAAGIEAAIQKEIMPDSEQSEEGAGTIMVDGKEVPAMRKVLLSKDGKKVLWTGQPYAKTGGVTVNNNSPDKPSEFDAAFLKDQGQEASKILTQARAAPAKVASLEALLSTNEKAISGSFPEFQVSFLRALQTLGWTTTDMDKMVNSSDFFVSNANAAVLEALGGSLGAQISDGDRKFVQATVPQLQSSPAARKALIEWLRAKAQHAVVRGKALQDHINNHTASNPRDKRTNPLTGFEEPAFNFDYGAGSKKPRTITTDDVKRYRERMGASVERFSDEQIKKVLEGVK